MVTDPLCRWCGGENETIQHLTLECPRFHSHRTSLLENLRRRGIGPVTMELLITGGNRPVGDKRVALQLFKKFLMETNIVDIV